MHLSAVRKLGLDDEGILELMAVVDLFSGFNKLMDGHLSWLICNSPQVVALAKR